MHFSTFLKLSTLIATVTVRVTAAQFNVTVGGAAGLVYTPQFVVSTLRLSTRATAAETLLP